MSGVQDVDLGIRQVTLIGVGTGLGEDEVTLAPEYEGGRSMLPEIGVPLFVALDVAAVSGSDRATVVALVVLRSTDAAALGSLVRETLVGLWWSLHAAVRFAARPNPIPLYDRPAFRRNGAV